MGGFKNMELKNAFLVNIFDLIVEKILLCSKMMKEDCLNTEYQIENNEEKIRNHLLEGYLDNDEVRTKIGLDKICLRFIPEVLENYKSSQDIYIGRVDIKVVTENWLRSSRKDYYTIECKRIDGNSDLNKKFVINGIARFVLEPVQYPSFNGKNIMFGFVVKEIDIEDNTLKIDKMQKNNFNGIVDQDLYKINSYSNESYTYSSKYLVNGSILLLKHLFFNFSPIIKA